MGVRPDSDMSDARAARRECHARWIEPDIWVWRIYGYGSGVHAYGAFESVEASYRNSRDGHRTLVNNHVPHTVGQVKVGSYIENEFVKANDPSRGRIDLVYTGRIWRSNHRRVDINCKLNGRGR